MREGIVLGSEESEVLGSAFLMSRGKKLSKYLFFMIKLSIIIKLHYISLGDNFYRKH
jgi:hypothetical protein